ncbi:MAG: hypothetical protein OEW78_04385 [Nitrosopumilus sp.]|uniref:hypothetical protein n=1 Tax=Nitrosopumilus sp. TaxID=2024843 RepID=UPI00246C9D45|nr:hypothetical protein [Nitrosopumilus sp.]MDH5431104.1 hypothetical protein [Nitrosopumilus sp.]
MSRDKEFKIQLSVEDINKLDDVIRGMSDSSKSIEKSNELKINTKNNQSTIKGLRLLNVCTNCKNEFIPKNSMINEKLCKSCLEK